MKKGKFKYFYLFVFVLLFIFAFYLFKIVQNFPKLHINTFFCLISYILLIVLFFKKTHSLFVEKEEAKRKYYYDELTGLPNHNKLKEDITDGVSLVIFDIKNFSHINKIYGYKTGDEVLKFTANSLKELHEKVYRTGEDEFAVLLENPVTSEEISVWYHTLFFSYDKFINITFLIGASGDKSDLLKTAKTALLHAKTQKKGFAFYNEKVKKLQQELYEKVKFLENTLKNDKIVPFYQCIVNRNKEIIKYEALMRIVENENICFPDNFLEHVKGAQLYNAFSRNMIIKVLKDLKSDILPKVSINISYEDIKDEIMRNLFYNFIDENIGKKLIIEILESESIKDFEFVKNFILDMKKKGIKIAIDDFGSGYSNFVEVLKLSPDYLKIDASLIRHIDNPKYLDIVKIITDFAHRYNIVVVAEYVDSKEVFEKLKKIGIDEFQGYCFCKPLPFDKILSKKGDNET